MLAVLGVVLALSSDVIRAKDLLRVSEFAPAPEVISKSCLFGLGTIDSLQFDWKPSTGKYYWHYTDRNVTFAEAEDLCSSKWATLATFRTEEEVKDILDYTDDGDVNSPLRC